MKERVAAKWTLNCLWSCIMGRVFNLDTVRLTPSTRYPQKPSWQTSIRQAQDSNLRLCIWLISGRSDASTGHKPSVFNHRFIFLTSAPALNLPRASFYRRVCHSANSVTVTPRFLSAPNYVFFILWLFGQNLNVDSTHTHRDHNSALSIFF